MFISMSVSVHIDIKLVHILTLLRDTYTPN
ncbi:MAG: hypothetical protein ACI86X_001509 [Moritella sp.]